MQIAETERKAVIASSSSLVASASHTFDVVVYIGRFQPFHLGHFAILKQALARGQMVVVVLGSSFRARDPKNPMNWTERAEMIRMSLTEDERSRVIFVPMRDYYDDARWVRNTVKAVTAAVPGARDIALIGHFKDSSSYYLNRFPGWKLLSEPRHTDIDATTVRKVLLETPEQPRDAIFKVVRDLMPAGAFDYLSAAWSLPHWAQLGRDALWLIDYRKKWTADFYLAADAVVTCNEKVLLIKRGRGQGKGLYALPGGFLEPGERFYDGAIRELDEETSFSMFDDGLRAYLKNSHLFDDPGRSPRGRIITQAFHFDLGERSREPEVKAKDDAQPHSAEWVRKEEIRKMEDRFFEDHLHIQDFLLDLIQD